LRNRDCHIHGVDFGDDADISRVSSHSARIRAKVRLRVRGVAEYCFNLLQMVEVVAGEMFRYRCDAFDASFSVDSVLIPLPLVERL